jgi:ubiquinone/menaquinone biosynthesis C-methylase UbiE
MNSCQVGPFSLVNSMQHLMADARAAARNTILQYVSRNVIDTVRYCVVQWPRRGEAQQTKQIIEQAGLEPEFLDYEMLRKLQGAYRVPGEYGYDPQTLKIRGAARARQLLRFPRVKRAQTFLELGCWDGMVCAALAEQGRQATGIDYRSTGFDSRVQGQNVELLEMDASNLQFEDNSFDCVFSYDAFEHFENPEAVLQEAIRVTAKNGHIYLDFGPLYYSPYGEHAYRSITVPYCQFLFSRETLCRFVEEKSLLHIDFKHVNGWSLDRYRSLWRKYSYALTQRSYEEAVDWSHLGLIQQCPSCFKSEAVEFENFTVSHIRVLFEKN